MKVLSNDSMRLNHLERHLKQQHPTLILKTKEFFSSKAESLKRKRLDTSGSYHTALAYKTLPQTSALNSRLFTLLCEDLDSDHKVLLFHTEVRWLSKGNMLARLYELKEEVILFLEFKEKTRFLDNVQR
ncbi:unnamed protein product [Acanthoscelides obtectus]|uniref:Zinc finger BED domain-containing protein 5 n=1 Tax=Acanthoscelides obtectus TaxID=200917 RepID=A0A9P0JVQ4_ACAOB|nr:unnamed protein product [Acanthoscelides obtectus]CAK1625227.1 SCAN domain-containing protein 3 [Acanthoscelides obtectus]